MRWLVPYLLIGALWVVGQWIYMQAIQPELVDRMWNRMAERLCRPRFRVGFALGLLVSVASWPLWMLVTVFGPSLAPRAVALLQRQFRRNWIDSDRVREALADPITPWSGFPERPERSTLPQGLEACPGGCGAVFLSGTCYACGLVHTDAQQCPLPRCPVCMRPTLSSALIERREFTCPECGSHHFGQSRADGGMCHGYLADGSPCRFRFPFDDPACFRGTGEYFARCQTGQR